MEQLRKLSELIKGLMVRKFFGVITITFKSGRIVDLAQKENLKI